MKKLFILLAAVGLFASCSKEEPVAPVAPEQAEQEHLEGPVILNEQGPADPKSSVRLTFSADIDPFPVDFEGAEDQDPSLRSIETDFVGTNDRTDKTNPGSSTKRANFIDFRLKEDNPGTGKTSALIYIYDKVEYAYFLVDVQITKDGKGIAHDAEIYADATKYPQSTRILSRLVENGLKGAKMALIIGYDPILARTTRTFVNKGAYLLKYEEGKRVSLPSGFVMLKSSENVLEPQAPNSGRFREMRVKNGQRIKLSLQGYLLGVRFRNNFPQKVVKHAWTNYQQTAYRVGANGNRLANNAPDYLVNRPNLRLQLRLSGLSVLQQQDVKFLTNNGQKDNGIFVVEPKERPAEGLQKVPVYNTPGLIPVSTNTNKPHTTAKYYRVELQNKATDKEVISVPVDGDRAKGSFRPNEEFILFYCPNPQDVGKVAFEPLDNLFYDGTRFSMYRQSSQSTTRYYTLSQIKNIIEKVKGRGDGTGKPTWRQQQPADGRVFLTMFDITPNPTTDMQGLPSFTSEAQAKLAAYEERNKEAKN